MADRMNHPVNLLEVLDGVPFPANKQQLVDYALDHDASEEVLDEIRAMPGDTFKSIQDINRHAGLLESQPGGENLWSSGESADLPDDAEIAATEFLGHGRI